MIEWLLKETIIVLSKPILFTVTPTWISNSVPLVVARRLAVQLVNHSISPTASAAAAVLDRTGPTGPEKHNTKWEEFKTRCRLGHITSSPCANSLFSSVVLCAASGRIQVLYSAVISVTVLKLVFTFPWEQCNKTSIGRTLGVWTTFTVPFSVPKIVFLEYRSLICIKWATLFTMATKFPSLWGKGKVVPVLN